MRRKPGPGMRSRSDELARWYAQQLGRPLISRREYLRQLRAAVEDRRGYASAKIGQSEKQWLYHPILRSHERDARRLRAYETALAYHFRVQAGLFPATPAFFRRFTDVYSVHLRELDCLGLFFDAPALECEIIKHYRTKASLIHYSNQEPDRSTPGDEANCYLPFLAGKKLLVVAPFAHFLRQRATAETFTGVWQKTGKPWFHPADVDSVEFPYGYEEKTRQTYGDALNLLDSIQAQIASKSFDVALIGAGGLGMPLAGFVKSLGKVGLSLGGHLQIIFGVYGRRWIDRHDWQARYFNEWWTRVPAAYRPAAALTTDDGAYW